MNKFLKGLVALLLAISPVFSELNVFAEESGTQTPETQATTTSSGYVITPGEVPVGEDGYSYVRPGLVTNQYGEEVYQIFYYSQGHSHTSAGWSGYVPSGSKTLFMSGDLKNPSNLGIGTTSYSATQGYQQAIFANGTYTGDIVSIQGAIYSSLLVTNTGEIWYTGESKYNMFGAAAERRTAAEKTQWVKMETTGIPANEKVVDAVLGQYEVFVITDAGNLYAQGGKVYQYFGQYGHVTSGNNDWKNANDFGKFKKVAIPNGEAVSRIWSANATEDDSLEYSRWFIVETTNGYWGAGSSSTARQAIGAFYSKGYGVGTAQAGMYQVMMGGTDGKIKAMPAGFIDQLVSYGDLTVVHILGTDGKVYTTGKSYWGNVSGTQYSYFKGWYYYADSKTSPTVYSKNESSVDVDVTQNIWDTNYFAYNDSLTDVEQFYDGILTLSYRSTDGTFMLGSEAGAAAGLSIKRMTSTSTDNYMYRGLALPCNWVYLRQVQAIENASEYYWVSTTWDKREAMTREYFVGMWQGSLAVDQDGFLRAAVKKYNYGETSADKTLSFPQVVAGVSTIRTVENYANVSNYNYLHSYYDNKITTKQTNARVVGEYMMFGGIQLASPIHTYDGEGTNNATDPFTVSLGPTYSGNYGLDPNNPGKASYKIYTDYEVYFSDEKGTIGASTGIVGTADITDVEAVLDLSGLAPGYYVTKSNRYVTDSTGVTYASTDLYTTFVISSGPRLSVPAITEITASDVPYEIKEDSGVSAIVRPSTDVTKDVYIEGYTPTNAALGNFTVGTVNTNSGDTQKNVEFTVETVDKTTTGVYVYTFAVEKNGEADTKNGVYVVNDGSIVIGEEYILQASDFLIGYNEFDDTDQFLMDKANVHVYDMTGQEITDSVVITVDAGTWKQEYGSTHDITFSVTEPTTGKTLTRVVEGSIDHLPTFTFDPLVLDVKETAVTADSYKIGVTAYDEEDGVLDNYTIDKDLENLDAGIYTVTYSVTDSHGNTATANRPVIINDGTIYVGDKYILRAHDFTVRLGQVDTSDAAIIREAKVEVIEIATMLNAFDDVTFTVNPAGYKKEIGEYPGITIKVNEDTNLVGTVMATVVAGEAPVLVAPDFTEVKLGESFDIWAGVSVNDAEDSLTLAD
ncbi:MAG: immunoglobulin-like domain-containing protein, partial [Anaerorhabdus sp.]